jgi:aminopeptidase I
MKVDAKDADVLSLDDFEGTPEYAQEFIDFIDEACSIYHTAAYFQRKLADEGFVELKESQVRISNFSRCREDR